MMQTLNPESEMSCVLKPDWTVQVLKHTSNNKSITCTLFHSGSLSSLIKSFFATNDIKLGLALRAPLQKLPGFDKKHAKSFRGVRCIPPRKGRVEPTR